MGISALASVAEVSWGSVRRATEGATMRSGRLMGGAGVAQRRSNDTAAVEDGASTSMVIVGREPAQQKCSTGMSH